MNMNLRTRMLLLALAPASIVAVLLSAFFVAYSLENLEQELRIRGSAISRQIAAGVEYGIFSGQRERLLALTESALRLDPDVRGAAVIDAQGTVMASSGDLHASVWPQSAGRHSRRLEPDVFLVVEPVMRNSLPVDDIYAGADAQAIDAKPIGHVVVELSRNEVSRKSLALIVITVALAMLAVALGAWLALRIARAVTKPLLEAHEVVARIGQGDLAARMATEPAGALRPLAIGINDMAGRLGVTQEDLRTRIKEATLGLQREKDAAEHATIAKSHFLAAASHDLRQPLHALGLFMSGLAQSEVARQEPKLVEHIQASVNSLQHLLDAILDISRLDCGNLVPQLGYFSMAEVLDRLPQSLALLAEQKGLQLKVRPTPAWVHSDQNIVERILLNLAGNALRYTHAGGVLVTCRRRRGMLRVQVWDTGEGIPEGARQEIFEDYVQLGNPERDRAKGLGLGLAICRRLADLLGIPLGVESRPGRGSVFWIELPTALPGATQAEGAVSDQAIDPARLSDTVLVVEGDAMVRAGMEQAIVGWGGRVVLASNRQEALERCRDSAAAPALTICSLRLPGGVNGIELAQELQREFEHMGILLVSADASEQAQAAARRAGFALLKEPVPPSRLRAALRQLLAPR